MISTILGPARIDALAHAALAWLTILGVCGIVSGVGRFYLRIDGAPVPFDADPLYDIVMFFGGFVAVLIVVIVMCERAARKSVAR